MTVKRNGYTEVEYFAVDENSSERWEYVDGQIRAMAGGTTEHGQIAGNIIRTLGNALVPKGCRVYGSDVKVHCGDGMNTYPDVSVVCGSPHLHGGRRDIYANPLLIVEVLSDSTEADDRGPKFDHYSTITSLADYLLVSQDEARALLYTRAGDHWEMRDVRGRDAAILLPSVGVTLALDDVYALISFSEEMTS